MSGFSADWLRLREPFDHQARQAAFEALALGAQAERWRVELAGAPLSVLDLACGSGSTLRALAPRLGGLQHWRLLDHDPALLAAVPHALAEWAQEHGHQVTLPEAGTPAAHHIEIQGAHFKALVTLEQADLVQDLHRLNPNPSGSRPHLITGSAILDLVSADWLRALVHKAHEAQAAMYFALSVDGQTAWTPPDPLDETVHGLFAAHQLRDKGFGPALGGKAVAEALRYMREAGYAVRQAPSNWVIDAQAVGHAPAAQTSAMLTAMIEGMASAALEQAQVSTPTTTASANQLITTWRTRRLAMLPTTRLQVGHIDIYATLP